jgi:hypothetical protein
LTQSFDARRTRSSAGEYRLPSGAGSTADIEQPHAWLDERKKEYSSRFRRPLGMIGDNRRMMAWQVRVGSVAQVEDASDKIDS